MTPRWSDALSGYMKPRVLVFLFLGFSCGLPFMLVSRTLKLWLEASRIEVSVIALFAAVMLPFSFKFVWAPVIDRLRIPYLARRIGQKKSWALVIQVCLMVSIFGLALVSPDQNAYFWEYAVRDRIIFIPMQTFIFAFLVAFFTASQDIVVDALRIDTLDKREFGQGSGLYMLGYRLGVLSSGAGLWMLVDYLQDWHTPYFIAGCCVLVGMAGIGLIREKPRASADPAPLFKSMFVDPFMDFMTRPSWLLILAFIALYKVCNVVLGNLIDPFYRQIGFNLTQIGVVSGAFGPFVTIFGALLGGVLAARLNILKTLFALGLVEILTSLVFAGLALLGSHTPAFVATIVFDNIIGGMGGAVFVAYLSGLCAPRYSATQYALLASLMTFVSVGVAMPTGFLTQRFIAAYGLSAGWAMFFAFTSVLMIPALMALAVLIRREKKA